MSIGSVVKTVPSFLTLAIGIFCPWLGLFNGLFYWFFKRNIFCSLIFFSTDFKFLISLISVITFNSWILALDLICTFYHFLRCKLWLLDLIFVLLIHACIRSRKSSSTRHDPVLHHILLFHHSLYGKYIKHMRKASDI